MPFQRGRTPKTEEIKRAGDEPALLTCQGYLLIHKLFLGCGFRFLGAAGRGSAASGYVGSHDPAGIGHGTRGFQLATHAACIGIDFAGVGNHGQAQDAPGIVQGKGYDIISFHFGYSKSIFFA
jgi:hypothetical protein